VSSEGSTVWAMFCYFSTKQVPQPSGRTLASVLSGEDHVTHGDHMIQCVISI